MRTRRGPALLLLAAVVAALAVGGSIAASAPVAAATTGAGIPGITPYGGYLGNYVAPDGTRVYCIDSGRDWPSGPTGAGSVTSRITTSWGTRLDETTLRRINFVLTTYGQTKKPELAAAVNAYLYAFTSGFAETNGAGYAAGLHYINGNTAVEATYAAVWAAAKASVATAPATATVTIEMISPRDGIVRVTTSPAGAHGTITLSNAVVDATGESSAAVTDGDEIAIRGMPPASVLDYVIEAAVTFRATAPPGPAVTLYLTGDQQRTIRHAAPTEVLFEAAATVGPIRLPFTPQLQSQVEHPTVGLGEALVDSLTVTLVDADEPWPEASGGPLSVVLVGTLYGPFEREPVVADAAPPDAPVRGTARLTVTGPGTYRSDGLLDASAPGYYTWVWRIAAADQTDPTRAALGDGYEFVDRFGLPAETVRATLTPELAATGAATNPGLAIAAFALVTGGMLVLGGGPRATRLRRRQTPNPANQLSTDGMSRR